jgi:cell wall-associated NlpC family hydrolase/nucleoid-associated protein YgaU
MKMSSGVCRVAAALVLLALPAVFTPAPAAAAGVYFVKDGDTLEKVSRIFGVEVAQILELNHLAGSRIAAGDKIRIPDRSAKEDLQPAALQPAVEALPTVAAQPSAAAQPPAADAGRHPELSPDRVLQAACREETVYHAVVKGDTLFSIASRYGTELDTLFQLNGLRKRSRLSIGQKIIVRKGAPRSYTVVRGDTLGRLAARYGVEIDELARLNHLDDDTLSVGQTLLIQPCDPYATAGSTPPPLAGTDAGALLAVDGVTPAPADAADDAGPGLSASAAAMAKRVINLARTMLNVPYRFGGSTLRGIDCSAYVQRVFGLMDVQIPRTAREQYAVGARVGRDDIQVGDLVFFRTYASYASHVGIYLGDNLFIHASSMVRRVSIDRMDQPYYRKRFLGARRLLVDGAPAVASTP